MDGLTSRQHLDLLRALVAEQFPASGSSKACLASESVRIGTSSLHAIPYMYRLPSRPTGSRGGPAGPGDTGEAHRVLDILHAAQRVFRAICQLASAAGHKAQETS